MPGFVLVREREAGMVTTGGVAFDDDLSWLDDEPDEGLLISWG